MIFMVIDHVYYFSVGIYNFPEVFGWVSRFVAPLFLYLSVFAYGKVSNKFRYISRVFIAGIIVGVVNVIFQKYIIGEGNINILTFFFPNIILTIACCLIFVNLIERKEVNLHSLFELIVISSLIIFLESGIQMLAMTLIFYIFRDRKLNMYIAFIVLCIFWAYQYYFLNNFLNFRSYQWFALSVIPFIELYNGEVGNRSFKYLFYIFYPLHIYIILIIVHFAK